MVITATILENSEYLLMICGNIKSHQQRNMLLKALPTGKPSQSHLLSSSWLHNHCAHSTGEEQSRSASGEPCS